MTHQTIRLERRQRVAFISLAKPDTGNVLDAQMAAELRQACQEVQADDQVWVVVLQAQGEAFCRGSQLSLPSQADGGSLEEIMQAMANHRVAAALGSVTKPVIAALQGDTLDQGLELALAADLRVAAVGARLGFPGVAAGALPWDGGTQRLPRTVGLSWAADLLLTGRLVDADEAHAMGLVSAVVGPQDLLRRAEEMASAMASVAPIAARYAKETVTRGMDMPLQDGLRLEADLNYLLFTTADRTEGIHSFLGQRLPSYKGE